MMQVLRYIILAVIIIGMLYAYFAVPEKPDKGISLTPKQVIEAIEQKKIEKQTNKGTAGTDEAPGTEPASTSAQ